MCGFYWHAIFRKRLWPDGGVGKFGVRSFSRRAQLNRTVAISSHVPGISAQFFTAGATVRKTPVLFDGKHTRKSIMQNLRTAESRHAVYLNYTARVITPRFYHRSIRVTQSATAQTWVALYKKFRVWPDCAVETGM